MKLIGAIVLLLLFLLLEGIHCPFQAVFGIPCPGCNMTTSLYYLLHGNIEASLFYHGLLIPTMIFAILVLWRHLKKDVKGLCPYRAIIERICARTLVSSKTMGTSGKIKIMR